MSQEFLDQLDFLPPQKGVITKRFSQEMSSDVFQSHGLSGGCKNAPGVPAGYGFPLPLWYV
jgi:hypothetical protein